jgi:hypothetical protein
MIENPAVSGSTVAAIEGIAMVVVFLRWGMISRPANHINA